MIKKNLKVPVQHEEPPRARLIRQRLYGKNHLNRRKSCSQSHRQKTLRQQLQRQKYSVWNRNHEKGRPRKHRQTLWCLPNHQQHVHHYRTLRRWWLLQLSTKETQSLGGRGQMFSQTNNERHQIPPHEWNHPSRPKASQHPNEKLRVQNKWFWICQKSLTWKLYHEVYCRNSSLHVSSVVEES